MDLDPFGRRELFVGAGGAFLCTLAGQRVLTDSGANVAELAGRRAGAAEGQGGRGLDRARLEQAGARADSDASTGSAPSR